MFVGEVSLHIGSVLGEASLHHIRSVLRETSLYHIRIILGETSLHHIRITLKQTPPLPRRIISMREGVPLLKKRSRATERVQHAIRDVLGERTKRRVSHSSSEGFTQGCLAHVVTIPALVEPTHNTTDGADVVGEEEVEWEDLAGMSVHPSDHTRVQDALLDGLRVVERRLVG